MPRTAGDVLLWAVDALGPAAPLIVVPLTVLLAMALVELGKQLLASRLGGL